jgi:hypothetical protein
VVAIFPPSTISTAAPSLQSVERRRNMLSAQCLAALDQPQTVAIGQTYEKSRIEFASIVFPIASGNVPE